MRVKTMSQAILLLGLIVAPCLAIAAEPTFKEGWFTTNDGVKLHYLEAGSGNPLVMIPGWSQSAMEFKYQLTGLSDKYHVYALDMRGHGESAKPNHGYRIQRLSADVHDFLVANNLSGVTLAGHSMGCSVIWGYWEQYGSDRLSKLILVDQMPMITSNPAWSPQELEDAGAIFDGKSLFDNVNALAGPDGVKTTEGFVRGMFTKQYPVDAVNWVIQENLKFPREYAARLSQAGMNVRLIEYPDAHHVFDGPVFREPVRLEGPTSRNCRFTEIEDGSLVNAVTKQPYSFSDPCGHRSGFGLRRQLDLQVDRKRGQRQQRQQPERDLRCFYLEL